MLRCVCPEIPFALTQDGQLLDSCPATSVILSSSKAEFSLHGWNGWKPTDVNWTYLRLCLNSWFCSLLTKIVKYPLLGSFLLLEKILFPMRKVALRLPIHAFPEHSLPESRLCFSLCPNYHHQPFQGFLSKSGKIRFFLPRSKGTGEAFKNPHIQLLICRLH